jgi:NAD(P)-dependent dehydrogenase (short-subunit alcohol dehydrogenase family)
MNSMFDLTGHVALVTGGNGGLGLGMAEGLAQAGANVCIWGTNEDKNALAVERLIRHDTKAYAQRVDVSDEQQVIDAMNELIERFGRLDTCIASAAVTIGPHEPPFVETTLEQWQTFMRVNLDGTFLTLREAAKHMITQGTGGSLVGLSSIGAQIGAPRDEAYAATKAGIAAMMRGLAVELGRYGIRCNTLVPGWTRSPSQESWEADPALAAAIMKRLPLKRWGEPEDWAGIAVCLASPTSSFLTGEEIRLDGGYVLT